VRQLVDHAHDRARFILTTHRATLDRLAAALIEKETLDDAELAEVFGDIDKGAGIDVPMDELERSAPLRTRREPRVDVRVAEAAAQRDAEARPAPSTATSLWRRVQRWRQLRAPRPSGT
jgi:Peptidase family M41